MFLLFQIDKLFSNPYEMTNSPLKSKTRPVHHTSNPIGKTQRCSSRTFRTAHDQAHRSQPPSISTQSAPLNNVIS